MKKKYLLIFGITLFLLLIGFVIFNSLNKVGDARKVLDKDPEISLNTIDFSDYFPMVDNFEKVETKITSNGDVLYGGKLKDNKSIFIPHKKKFVDEFYFSEESILNIAAFILDNNFEDSNLRTNHCFCVYFSFDYIEGDLAVDVSLGKQCNCGSSNKRCNEMNDGQCLGIVTRSILDDLFLELEFLELENLRFLNEKNNNVFLEADIKSNFEVITDGEVILNNERGTINKLSILKEAIIDEMVYKNYCRTADNIEEVKPKLCKCRVVADGNLVIGDSCTCWVHSECFGQGLCSSFGSVPKK